MIWYTPFSKAKRGESVAYQQLSAAAVSNLLPLFDVPAISKDRQHLTDHSDHFLRAAGHISAAVGGGTTYVDYFDVQPKFLQVKKQHAAVVVSKALDIAGVDAIPVTGFDRDASYNAALPFTFADGNRLAIRLLLEDLVAPHTLVARIKKLVGLVGVAGLTLHVLIDLRALGPLNIAKTKALVFDALTALVPLGAERVVLAGSSMPAAGDLPKGISFPDRKELGLWEDARAAGHATLAFGDYGVIHPDYVDLDPRIVKGAAKVRYATAAGWTVVKGKRWMDDTGQHASLAKLIAKLPGYRVATSWGELVIADAVAKGVAPKTLEKWVSIDTNVHLEFMTATVTKTVTKPLVVVK